MMATNSPHLVDVLAERADELNHRWSVFGRVEMATEE